MSEEKSILRERLRAERQRLPAREAVRLSGIIVERVIDKLDWGAIKTVHLYSPLTAQREVDARLLLEKIWQAYPAILTATWGKARSTWVSPTGRAPALDGQQYDLIVVPLIGFNTQCHRIGFGGGSYDRFLAGQPQAQTIGLAYDFALCDFQPEAHDVALDFICTEKQILSRP